MTTEATIKTPAKPRLLADMPPLSETQAAALQTILTWLEDPNEDAFAVLRGYAGTGKTFLARRLPLELKGRIVWTAPTNKATKCLREALTADDYKPECRTIYSLLGLRLEPSGELKELTASEETVDLTLYRLVVIDEGFMVGSRLLEEIETAQRATGVRFLFMGDPYQLRPVKEKESPIKRFQTLAELTEVRRHDNQILTLVTRIRDAMDKPIPVINLASDNDGEEGVWRLDRRRFDLLLQDKARLGWFSDGRRAKAIAWRNLEVDRLNLLIRGQIFPGVTEPFVVGDRVIFTAPAKDLEDKPIASTDDEGLIERVTEEPHPLYPEFDCLTLEILLDTNHLATARVLHPRCKLAFERKKADLAAMAKSNGKFWRNFWDFNDAFHAVRYAYALTSHRSQGSTYENVFVLWSDILRNPERLEAFQCLYVACSRAQKRLVLGD